MTAARGEGGTVVVCCAADGAYAMPLAVMAASLEATLASGWHVELYVFDEGLGVDARARVRASVDPSRVRIAWLDSARARVARLPLWGGMHPATYDRLTLPEWMPAGIARAIWLDCDIIVARDISRLWREATEGHLLLAVQDLVVPLVSSRYGVAAHRELGLPSDAKYFNAGVMLVDLDAWRTADLMTRAMDYLREHRRTVGFWDQDALNATCAGRWRELDLRWNHLAGVSGRPFIDVSHFAREAYRRMCDDPWIIHFAGSFKPWRYRGSGSAHTRYFEVLDRTAWKGWRPPRTVRGRLLGLYERRLRNALYPAESWRMALLRAWG